MVTDEELKAESDKQKEELLLYIATIQDNILKAQNTKDIEKATKEEAKKANEEFKKRIIEIILLYYLLGYRRVDKKAEKLPLEHISIAKSYSDSIVETFSTRLSQLVQNSRVYSNNKSRISLLKKINDKSFLDIVKKTDLTQPDIWIKFAGRTVTLENYTKMLTNTAEQTASVNATINKWIQEQIYTYQRIEYTDKRTCKICKAKNGTIWDVSKDWIPPALYHPMCRWYRKPIIN